MSTSNYSSYATNSTSHSREYSYNCEADPTCGDYTLEGGYFSDNESHSVINNTVRYVTDYRQEQNHYNADRDQYAFGSALYYRSNHGDLRVFDRPYDIVTWSEGVRGGVARTYTDTYWGAPSAVNWLIVLVVIAVAFGAYALGRGSSK